MKINDELLLDSEKIVFALRSLYSGYGYKPYRMSKFEEYDLYAENKEFLVSDNVITFTDTDGKLMALKPDVTLSIIKNVRNGEKINKVYYSESVYRKSGGEGSFKEIMQTGLECFGDISDKEVAEVIFLAAKSLITLKENCVLDVSDIGVIDAVISEFNLTDGAKKALYGAIGEKNAQEISAICEQNGVAEDKAAFLTELLSVGGYVKTALPKLSETLERAGKTSVAYGFINTLKALALTEAADIIRLDFSVIGDANYYNGTVFKGFVSGAPEAVLSGGQYDKLMRKFDKGFKAIGFAVYMDALERVNLSGGAESSETEYLNIALPKGRLGEKVYALFAGAGYECPAAIGQNRKLIFENAEKKVRYFWVKPSDVAFYVERGAADIGVAGKDILLEYRPNVYELLDLKAGKCKMAVAAKKDFCDDDSKTLRVATKFTRIAKEYYLSEKGRDIDIIKLNGSIEIAPILGLSDVIVDIVETGETLKENDLKVVETIVPISARLIANKASAKFKEKAIRGLANGIAAEIDYDKNIEL